MVVSGRCRAGALASLLVLGVVARVPPAAAADAAPGAEPALPALPQTSRPPAGVVGLIVVPEVMRQSTAARQAQVVLLARQEKLKQEVEREQAVWQATQQQILAQRAQLPAAEVQRRAQALQARVTAAQQRFRRDDQAVREAQAYALGQIRQVVEAVVRQVAQSRGMNMVLAGEGVALNTSGFDITADVVAQVNKVLPSVDMVPGELAAAPVPRPPRPPARSP